MTLSPEVIWCTWRSGLLQMRGVYQPGTLLSTPQRTEPLPTTRKDLAEMSRCELGKPCSRGRLQTTFSLLLRKQLNNIPYILPPNDPHPPPRGNNCQETSKTRRSRRFLSGEPCHHGLHVQVYKPQKLGRILVPTKERQNRTKQNKNPACLWPCPAASSPVISPEDSNRVTSLSDPNSFITDSNKLNSLDRPHGHSSLVNPQFLPPHHKPKRKSQHRSFNPKVEKRHLRTVHPAKKHIFQNKGRKGGTEV